MTENDRNFDLIQRFDNRVKSNHIMYSVTDYSSTSDHMSVVTEHMKKYLCITFPIQNNGSVPIAPTIMFNLLQYPIENDDMNEHYVDQLRQYIKKESYEGSKWSHPTIVKDSIDKNK